MLDKDACRLYELYGAQEVDGAWEAGSGAQWDLDSNALRPLDWTSADAAGLPILPGLVRYDELAAGRILHALRFTAPVTRKAYIYPARHYASSSTSTSLPPMGLRVRLKATANLTGLSPQAKVIAVALQRYGMILADNGSPWYVSGMSRPAVRRRRLPRARPVHRRGPRGGRTRPASSTARNAPFRCGGPHAPIPLVDGACGTARAHRRLARPGHPGRPRGAAVASDRGAGDARGPARRPGVPRRPGPAPGDVRGPRHRPCRATSRSASSAWSTSSTACCCPRRPPERRAFVTALGVATAYLHDIGMVDMTRSGRRLHGDPGGAGRVRAGRRRARAAPPRAGADPRAAGRGRRRGAVRASRSRSWSASC